MKLKKHLFIFLALMLPITFTMYGKKDSLYTNFLSRLYPGVYAMGSIETTKHTSIYDYQMKPSKITEYEIKYGINSEIKLSDRRAIRIGFLFSELTYPFWWYPENPILGVSETPRYGDSYYLKITQYRYEFPIEYKYTLLKSSRKTKIKPYFLVGFSPIFMYKEKFIYKNNGGITTDHTETKKKFVNYSTRPILTFGVNYEITRKMNLYLEPHYIRYKTFGLAMGMNIHF